VGRPRPSQPITTGSGLPALSADVSNPGRKRKLDLLELEAKLWPLLGPAQGSVTKIRHRAQQKKHAIG
jgi:hypothetical protein